MDMEEEVNENETILYELFCCSEWNEDKEDIFNQTHLPSCPSSLLSYINPKQYMRNKANTLQESVTWLKYSGPAWQYSFTSDGKILAILQSSILETRSLKDNFSSVLGKNTVIKDPYSSYRCMTWSEDSSLLAISFTNGLIAFFDIMASQLFSVRRFSIGPEDVTIFSPQHALVGLFFVDERVIKSTFVNELVCCDIDGRINAYRQTSANEMILHHESSVRKYYPNGITAVEYVAKHSIILVAGKIIVDTPQSKDSNLIHGLTAWRLLNDHPYYKIVFNTHFGDFRMDSKRMWKIAFSAITPKSGTAEDAIFKMIQSPNGDLISALHVNGTISIWHVPSLTQHRLWPLKCQFHYNSENQRFNVGWRAIFNRVRKETMDSWRFNPYDINWWNDNTLIISRINGSVSLCSIAQDLPQRNLLGDSPELFESSVCVSSHFNKGFFVFECEISNKEVTSRNANENGSLNTSANSTDSRRDSISSGDLSSANINEVEEQVQKKQLWVKTIAQEILFWMTDIEQFRPPRKAKKKSYWTETYRLFNLKSITPLELFHRKIEREEYGEALDLARAYNLDCDLVYQRQWTKNPVSVNTIRDYLAKIEKRNWVLQECKDRVPENIDAARELLQFGLRGTDLTPTVMISQGRDNGKFILTKPDALDDLEISEEEYLTLVDVDKLEVQRILQYRKQFLYYLDILNTYEQMLGGALAADENFDPKIYSNLRSHTPFESAIEMSRNSDINGLRILLSNHWESIESNYLQVLTNFPEIISPQDYRDFLPEIDFKGNPILWDNVSIREPDWSDKFLNNENEGANSHLNNNKKKNKKVLTAQNIETWYLNRIHDIESLSGMTNYSYELARLGIDRNIKLDELQEELNLLLIMIYEINIFDMDLTKLKKLNPLERLKLIMSKSTEETFVNHFQNYLVPFLDKCEDKSPGSRFFLLSQYLTSISQESLDLPLKIFEKSKRENLNPIIWDVGDLMQLAYNCVFACKNCNQSSNILAILGCLPDREYCPENEAMDKMHDDIDILENHYNAAQTLAKYDIHITLKEILLMAEKDEESIANFFIRLCRNANKLPKGPLNIAEWKILLYDLLEIQKKVFVILPLEKCFEIYVTALLRSGKSDVIYLARDFLESIPLEDGEINSTTDSTTTTPGNKRRDSSAYSTSFALYLYIIPYDKSLEMVLDAAELYFDSASNYADSDIELAKVCLNLIQNSKESKVSRMFDLIDAVKILNKDFELNILPQTVRMTEDKIGLLKKAMLNIDQGYKKTKQLHKLGLFLSIDGMDVNQIESLVLDMSGDFALSELDMKFCVQICHNILAKQYNAGWNVFTQLSKVQTKPPLINKETRLDFVNYALKICPDEEILSVLNILRIMHPERFRFQEKK